MKFVHLHVHSHYSLLDGLPKIEGLVLKAKALGMNALALTDPGSLYGAIEFYKTTKKHGIKPIIGSEGDIAARGMRDRQAGFDDRRFHLTLLAQNNQGYKNLIKLVTVANLEGFYYKPRLDKEALRCYSDGLIALSGCLSGEIPRAIITKDLERAEALVQEYKDIFGDRFYIELAHHPKIQFSEELNRTLLGYAEKYQIMIVATCDAHYLEKDEAKATSRSKARKKCTKHSPIPKKRLRTRKKSPICAMWRLSWGRFSFRILKCRPEKPRNHI